jgi:hypothetical protein
MVTQSKTLSVRPDDYVFSSYCSHLYNSLILLNEPSCSRIKALLPLMCGFYKCIYICYILLGN